MRTNKHGYNRKKNLDFFFSSFCRHSLCSEWTVVVRFLMRCCCCCCCYYSACCCCRSFFRFIFWFMFSMCRSMLLYAYCRSTNKMADRSSCPETVCVCVCWICSLHTPYAHKLNAQHMWNEMNNDIDDDLFVAMSHGCECVWHCWAKLCSTGELNASWVRGFDLIKLREGKIPTDHGNLMHNFRLQYLDVRAIHV